MSDFGIISENQGNELIKSMLIIEDENNNESIK